MEQQLAEAVFRRYCAEDVLRVTELRGGKINRTFRVETHAGTYICQRLSRAAFSGAADAIEHNYLRYRDACAAARDALGAWEAPQWMRTGEGRIFFTDRGGGGWRVYPMIRGRVFASADELPDGGLSEFARGLAALHFVLDRFAGRPETVIGRFHDLDFYCGEYLSIRSGERADAAVNAYIDEQMEFFSRALPVRQDAVIHADTRLANAVFAPDGRVTAFIDIDTFSTGSRLIDLADSIRSVAGAGEAAPLDPQSVRFRKERCDEFVSAYLSSPFCGLAAGEAACIPQYLLRVTFELGVRYYTDYLRGNPYFRTERPEDTLRQARGQFALLEEMRRHF